MTVRENLEMGAFQQHKEPVRTGYRTGPRSFPDASGTEQAAGGDAVRRRAADACDRQGAHVAAPASAAGRTVARTGADHRQQDIQDHQGDQRAGDDDPARGAECKGGLRLAHRAYVMETGKIVMQGKASVLENDPGIKKAYLGE